MSTRIPKVGRWARGLAMACFAIATASFLGFVAAGWFGASLSVTLIAIALQTLSLIALLRSWAVGVYTTQSGVRAVSWLRTRDLAWSEIRRSDAIPYCGALSKGMDTRLLSMIQITLANGGHVAIRASVTTPRAASEQARALNDIIRTRTEFEPSMTTQEKLRKTLRGSVVSSLGYRVRVEGPVGIRYVDDQGPARIDSEASAFGHPGSIVVYVETVPDEPQRPRSLVLDRVVRALEYAGWEVALQ